MVTGASIRSTRGWATEIGAAGRLAMGEDEPQVTPQSWFDLASITKPLTALTAVRLVRAGKLSLGDHARQAVTRGGRNPERSVLRSSCCSRIERVSSRTARSIVICWRASLPVGTIASSKRPRPGRRMPRERRSAKALLLATAISGTCSSASASRAHAMSLSIASSCAR